MPEPIENTGPVYHIFPVMATGREELQQYLLSQGIETLIHYPALPYQQKAYGEMVHLQGSFPVAEKIATEQLSLPLWPGMTEENVSEVSDQIQRFYSEKG